MRRPFHQAGGATLYQGSCERMPEIEDNSINLIVTSPPYFIEPGDTFLGPALLRSESSVYQSYSELLELLTAIFAECFRVLRPGGYCAVVVASTRVEKRLYPLPFDLAIRLISSGWQLQEDIVWRRWRGWDHRGGVLLQHPFPGYYFPNSVHEHVMLFQKPGPPIYKSRTEEEREASRLMIDKRFYGLEMGNDVWNILPVTPAEKAEHPCPYPEELAARLIELYSYTGDLVLDPFSGSGTTGKVAKLLGRRFVGYELNPAFVRLSQARFQEPSLHRQRYVARFEKLSQSS